VRFSAPLDPVGASKPALYTVYDSGPDHRFGTRDDRPIRIRLARYDARASMVTLLRSRRLPLWHHYVLRIDGSTRGLRDVSGLALDGNPDGRPGGEFKLIFGGKTLSGPASHRFGARTGMQGDSKDRFFFARTHARITSRGLPMDNRPATARRLGTAH